MSDFLITILAIIISFALGSVVWLFLLRGFIIPWLKARGGGYLVRIVRRDGSVSYRAAKLVPGGALKYVYENKEKHIKTLVEGSILRDTRVRTVTVDERDTAPFSFTKVEEVETEQEELINKPLLDKNDEPIITNGVQQYKQVKEMVKRVGYRLFTGYDDSHIISNVIDWALMRPSKKLPGIGLDAKTVLIGLLVIAGGVYLIMTMSGGAANVVP